jgi:ribosomal protein S18 acetylase RimI-like enzyme
VEAARPATPADLPHLCELADAARAELAPTRGGAVFVEREGRAAPVEPTLRQDLDDPDVLLVAGTIDESVVGYACGRTEVLRDGSRLGVIGDLFVLDGGRSVGVGEAMMDLLLEWFRAQGCAGVDATALPGNRATKNFFEGSGFTARLLVMHHRLEP